MEIPSCTWSAIKSGNTMKIIDHFDTGMQLVKVSMTDKNDKWITILFQKADKELKIKWNWKQKHRNLFSSHTYAT